LLKKLHYTQVLWIGMVFIDADLDLNFHFDLDPDMELDVAPTPGFNHVGKI
jgi:hypothetical protein